MVLPGVPSLGASAPAGAPGSGERSALGPGLDRYNESRPFPAERRVPIHDMF